MVVIEGVTLISLLTRFTFPSMDEIKAVLLAGVSVGVLEDKEFELGGGGGVAPSSMTMSESSLSEIRFLCPWDDEAWSCSMKVPWPLKKPSSMVMIWPGITIICCFGLLAAWKPQNFGKKVFTTPSRLAHVT